MTVRQRRYSKEELARRGQELYEYGIRQQVEFHSAQEPGIKGFEKRNLYRMRQFYETYPNSEIVSSLSLLTQLSWTHHTILISRCKKLFEKFLESLSWQGFQVNSKNH